MLCLNRRRYLSSFSSLPLVVWIASFFFFFSSRRRHTRYWRDWSSDVCSSDLAPQRGRWAPRRQRRTPPGGRPPARPTSLPRTPTPAPDTAASRDRHPCGRRSSRRGPSSVERSSEEDLEQAREVLVRVERDVDLPLPFRAQCDPHVGAQPAAQRLFDAPHLGGLPYSALEARPPLRCAPAAHAVLDLADREPLRNGLPREGRRRAGILEREEPAGMTHGEVTAMQHRQHRLGQLQKPERVGDGGAIAPHGVRHVLLREIEFRDEAVVAAGFVEGREVVALQVLDEGERQHGAVVHFAFHRRDALPAY